MMVAQFRVVMTVCGEKQLESRNIFKVDPRKLSDNTEKKKSIEDDSKFSGLSHQKKGTDIN